MRVSDTASRGQKGLGTGAEWPVFAVNIISKTAVVCRPNVNGDRSETAKKSLKR